MKQEWPKWVYSKTGEPMIINEPPVPKGYGTWAQIFGNEQEKLEVMYESFSREELITYAEDLGITVDKRKSKASIIELIEANA